MVESKIIFVIVFFWDSYSRQIAFSVLNIKFEDLQSDLLGSIPQNLRIQHSIVGDTVNYNYSTTLKIFIMRTSRLLGS